MAAMMYVFLGYTRPSTPAPIGMYQQSKQWVWTSICVGSVLARCWERTTDECTLHVDIHTPKPIRNPHCYTKVKVVGQSRRSLDQSQTCIYLKRIPEYGTQKDSNIYGAVFSKKASLEYFDAAVGALAAMMETGANPPLYCSCTSLPGCHSCNRDCKQVCRTPF